jgi:hypothetical protein
VSPARRSKSSASRTPRRAPKPSRDFWGPDLDPGAPEPAPEAVHPADHPTALIRSLGTPPLPNAGVAQHYFEAVYERAAALAIALATSAALAETPPSDPA